MKWISVKDYLPEKYKRVLVTDGETICLHYKQSGWNFHGSEGDDLYPIPHGLKDSNNELVSCCSIDSITHWMYFPDMELPKPSRGLSE